MSEKVIGYMLLIIGILIIASSAFSVYSVFTKQSNPINLFTFSGISIDATSLLGGDLTPAQREMAKQAMGNAKMEIFPADILNSTSNVIAHLLLMGFMAGIGSRFATLGIMLVRPIVVKMKEAPLSIQK